ncbi:hypothetical protein ACH5RR_035344 [Cinchona calisaya]|uniref:Enoyl reductase (ER) domain-containing protein n=1 Tax=Cinchona calisaya TaxID=153742 RepID=A0ABD2YIX3_9GENT
MEMEAVVITQPGGVDSLRLCKIGVPVIKPDEVLIKVVAVGVNRYDLVLRQGLVPGHQTFSHFVPGLECSGVIIDKGPCVTRWQIGDEVCALLDGGGYAEMVAVHAGQIFPCPRDFPIVDCAILPGLAYNAWLAVSVYAKLRPGDSILIYEGCGEIGMLAVQLAKHKGARVFVAADSEEKLKVWKPLGADVYITGNEANVPSQMMKETRGLGVDVILVDQVANLSKNLECMALASAIVIIKLRGDPMAKLYIPHLIAFNCRIKVLDPDMRSIDPASVVKEVEEHLWPIITACATCLRKSMLEYKKYELSGAANAHRYMEMVPNCCKTVLTIPDGEDLGKSQIMQEIIRSQLTSFSLRHRHP